MHCSIIRLIRRFIFVTVTLLLSFNTWAQQYPYQNTNLSDTERAKDLISRLSLEEKVGLMIDQSEAVPRLGINKFNWWSEALHGLANNSNVTVFPEPIGMAASFDDELVFKVFDATSDEARAKYHNAIRNGEENVRFLSLSMWTPNVNIFRDPRWGRGPETYGEDPYLSSRMGIAVVNGLQGPKDSNYKKLLACAKHYAVHSGPEWSRHSLNVNNISARDLRETYLPAFKALVQEGDVREVMCAYQRLDDEPCCGNTRLLQRILRDEWGFKYLVVSDCDAIADFYHGHKVSSDATHAAAKGVLAGTDVECAWINYNYANLVEAVENDLIKEDEIDVRLQRILEGRFSVGEMDPDSMVPWTNISMDVVNSDKHRKLALDMAHETMTLLQNENSVLPLSKSIKKLAVIGPNANDELLMWGSYNGIPNQTSSILEGIKTKIKANKIVYDKGCDIIYNKDLVSYVSKAGIDGQGGIKATYWNNNAFEGNAVSVVQLPDAFRFTSTGDNQFCEGVNKINFGSTYETTFTPEETGEVAFRIEVCGWVGLYVNDVTLTEFHSWKPMFATESYQMEKGKEYKITLRFKQTDTWPATLGFDFGKEVPVNYDNLISKLKGIDVVVFAGGISSQLEGEEMPVKLPGFKGGDRTNIELPEVQRNCLKALKAAGKKVVFVSCSGSALALSPETESCDAILQAWYAGEEGGQAVADVLFGDYNPSGKLPVTFYRNSNQLPDFEDYSMAGRTYRFMDEALFPFGYGLSYTSFNIGDANVNTTTIKKNEDFKFSIPLSNIGGSDGAEVLQVYVKRIGDTDGPLKSLKAYKRVQLAKGKNATIEMTLPYKSFENYDVQLGEMRVSPGKYEIMYGNSSASKDLKVLEVEVM